MEIDGNVITGRGPGFAVEFGLAILAAAAGEETAQAVATGMLVR